MTYWENVIKEMEENESFITKHPFIGIVFVCSGCLEKYGLTKGKV